MFKFLLDVAVRIDWGEVLPLVYRGLIGAIVFALSLLVHFHFGLDGVWGVVSTFSGIASALESVLCWGIAAAMVLRPLGRQLNVFVRSLAAEHLEVEKN